MRHKRGLRSYGRIPEKLDNRQQTWRPLDHLNRLEGVPADFKKIVGYGEIAPRQLEDIRPDGMQLALDDRGWRHQIAGSPAIRVRCRERTPIDLAIRR